MLRFRFSSFAPAGGHDLQNARNILGVIKAEDSAPWSSHMNTSLTYFAYRITPTLWRAVYIMALCCHISTAHFLLFVYYLLKSTVARDFFFTRNVWTHSGAFTKPQL